jgi:hypothetical protein
VVALVTLSEFKTWMGLTDTAQDAAISAIIPAASATVEQAIDRPATQAAIANEVHDGNGSARLWVRRWPIASISQLTIDGQSVSASDFLWADRTVTLLRGRRFTLGTGNILVSYTGGWVTLPDDVRQAVFYTVQAMLYAAAADPNLLSESTGGVFGGTMIATGPGSLPPAARSLLQPYMTTFAT